MNNSLYNSFGMQNNISQIVNDFNNFKNNFKGDPRAEVEKMMRSGQLSQEQFNQYAQMANELAKYIRL
jgi:major membrane immunogen (membrane-anchored lipoprotein)